MKKCTMLAIKKVAMTSKQFINRVFAFCKTLFKSLQNNISVSVKRDGEKLIVQSNDFYKVD